MGTTLELYDSGVAAMISSRLSNIDALRGIASIAVCWFHLTNGYAESSLVRASGRYGWLGVEIFFVLSGFIIPWAMRSGGYGFKTGWKTFLSKRLTRIEPPYVASIILVLALWQISSLVPGFHGSSPPAVLSKQTLFHIGYLNGYMGLPWLSPVYWTLAIEFQFYLLMMFAYGLLSSKRYPAGLAVVALVGLAFISASGFLVFSYLGLFGFGLASYQYRCALIDRTMLGFLFLLALIVSGLLLGWMVAFMGLITGIILVLNIPLGSHRMMIWLGSISYSLYLVHVPIGGRVVNLGRRFIDSESGEACLSLLALVTSLIAAHLFYLAIEKPSQEWAASFKYHPSR